MTETEWLACDDPQRMLDFLVGNDANTAEGIGGGRIILSYRKLRLFAVACCRQVFPELPDQWRRLVIGFEKYADQGLGKNDMAAMRSLAHYLYIDAPQGPDEGWYESAVFRLVTESNPIGCVRTLIKWGVDQVMQAHLLRDIAGNPFRPVPALPYLYTGDRYTIHQLAQAIYDDHRYEDMPILADALEDAGCTDEEVLRHCRGEEICWGCGGTQGFQANSTWVPCELCDEYQTDVIPAEHHPGKLWKPLRGPHARGCWVVDICLGKE